MSRLHLLTFSIALALLGCAMPAPSTLTPAQQLYAAFASYSVALGAAADYAQSPAANPSIVRALAAANAAQSVVEARRFGRLFVLCNGDARAARVDAACSELDLRPATISGYATTLRSVSVALMPGARK